MMMAVWAKMSRKTLDRMRDQNITAERLLKDLIPQGTISPIDWALHERVLQLEFLLKEEDRPLLVFKVEKELLDQVTALGYGTGNVAFHFALKNAGFND